MNVLLLSMPDSFEHMPPVAIRMPNGALTSLAGNVDPHHHVAVADLILVHDRVLDTVERLLQQHLPDIVGLSVMTFQRRTALRLIAHIRQRLPHARVVVGGYDPSLAPEAYGGFESGVDAIVRGEGVTCSTARGGAISTPRPAPAWSASGTGGARSGRISPPFTISEAESHGRVRRR